MTYEEALQIAIEQLDDAVDYLKAMNKGFPKVEKQVNELRSASCVLKEMQAKSEWVGLTENEILDICKQHADDSVTEAGFLLNVFRTYEDKLKEKNA